MNDTQQKYIGWFLIVLLFTCYITINNIIFLKINQQESENNVKALTENMDEFRMLLEVNQSRIEKRYLTSREVSILNVSKVIITQDIRTLQNCHYLWLK